MRAERALRVGIGGPVGSGKSSLIAALCAALAGDVRLGVVTNDIYTTEDAEFLRATGVLPEERIAAVQTGGCPHTAIRDDISANLDAVAELEAAAGPLDLVFLIEDQAAGDFRRGRPRCRPPSSAGARDGGTPPACPAPSRRPARPPPRSDVEARLREAWLAARSTIA